MMNGFADFTSDRQHVDLTQPTLEFVMSSEGTDWLNRLADPEFANRTPLQWQKQLRKQFSPQNAGAIVLQHELRQRAAKKFSLAQQMFFSRLRLEQATGEAISIYKAKRFTGRQRVADLCCGIGGDAVGLATIADKLTLIDADPLMTTIAQHNTSVYQASASALTQAAETTTISNYDAYHIDPDRRVENRKSTRAELFAPSELQLRKMLEANPHAAIKLAPATRFDFPAGEREYIGYDRECKQQIFWSGSLKSIHPGNESIRRATVVNRQGNAIDSYATAEPLCQFAPIADSLEQNTLIVPHPCLIAASLGESFAITHDWSMAGGDSHYLFSDHPYQGALAQSFRIIDHANLDPGKVNQMLRRHDAGKLEWKKSGIDVATFDRVVKKTKPAGDQHMTLALTDSDQGKLAILCQRINDSA